MKTVLMKDHPVYIRSSLILVLRRPRCLRLGN